MSRAVLGVACLAACAGCSAPAAHTTFLRSVDVVDMTDRMAESLAGDEVIGRRTAESERWVVSLDRVSNQTNQIIPSREKWLYMARLRSLLAESEFARRHNIVWVVPPEQWPASGGELDEAGSRLTPTHVLAARFNTLTNTSAAGRSDMYVCSYQLTDLASGRLVWEDWWEVKRVASGLTYD